MGYLGRAESWVEARRLDGPFQPNCSPGSRGLDESSGELREVITLLASLPQNEYSRLRTRFLSDKKAQKKLGPTLPEDLLGALSVETADLRKLGWSQPPAARKVNYTRPLDALRPQRVSRKAPTPGATTVRFVLVGKPLPRVEDSVRIGELLRSAVMSEAKKQLGEGSIPAIFSGHGLPAGARHRHAFYLPWDSNDDGRIDRLVLHVPEGMGAAERRVAEKLRRLWSRDGSGWRLVVEDAGHAETGGPLLAAATQWQSITPYLHPWHLKKNFDVAAQIRRECRGRGLAEPLRLEELPSVEVGSQSRKTLEFHRFRGKRGLNQPDRLGSFWRMTFVKPVHGPLALGFGCHYGLGLFRPFGAPGTGE